MYAEYVQYVVDRTCRTCTCWVAGVYWRVYTTYSVWHQQACLTKLKTHPRAKLLLLQLLLLILRLKMQPYQPDLLLLKGMYKLPTVLLLWIDRLEYQLYFNLSTSVKKLRNYYITCLCTHSDSGQSRHILHLLLWHLFRSSFFNHFSAGFKCVNMCRAKNFWV